jgi:hypothetical protein
MGHHRQATGSWQLSRAFKLYMRCAFFSLFVFCVYKDQDFVWHVCICDTAGCEDDTSQFAAALTAQVGMMTYC